MFGFTAPAASNEWNETVVNGWKLKTMPIAEGGAPNVYHAGNRHVYVASALAVPTDSRAVYG
jgi:hypothetical protein